MNKKLIIIICIIAASVVILLTLGIIGIYSRSKSDETAETTETARQNETAEQADASDSSENSGSSSKDDKQDNDDEDTESGAEKSEAADDTAEPVNTGDSFEWLYKFLSRKNPEDKLVTEGEYVTIKKALASNTDELGRLIVNSKDNLFSGGEDVTKFGLLYYDELEKHKNAEWLNDATKDYFKTIATIPVSEDADVEKVITDIDEGIMGKVEATEKTKYIIYALVANKKGYIEQMPYYDAAAILDKMNEASEKAPELDELFQRLRSKHNGVE